MSNNPSNLHASEPAIAAAVARMVGALPQAWQFARACMRLTGCSDDHSPIRPVDPSIVDRANEETFQR